MLHLADHSAHLGAVLQLAAPVHLVEAEADQRRPLVLGPADRRSGLGDLDRPGLGLGRGLGHRRYSTIAAASASAACEPPRPSRSTIFLPRRCATDFGEVCSVSAAKVARTML